jgi:hypothetical protein
VRPQVSEDCRFWCNYAQTPARATFPAPHVRVFNSFLTCTPRLEDHSAPMWKRSNTLGFSHRCCSWQHARSRQPVPCYAPQFFADRGRSGATYFRPSRVQSNTPNSFYQDRLTLVRIVALGTADTFTPVNGKLKATVHPMLKLATEVILETTKRWLWAY